MILELIGVLADIMIVLGILMALVMLIVWVIRTAPDDVEED